MKSTPSDAKSPRRISAARQPTVCSRKLFGDANEIIIEHLGEAYRLRRTRNGKLLLNK